MLGISECLPVLTQFPIQLFADNTLGGSEDISSTCHPSNKLRFSPRFLRWAGPVLSTESTALAKHSRSSSYSPASISKIVLIIIILLRQHEVQKRGEENMCFEYSVEHCTCVWFQLLSFGKDAGKMISKYLCLAALEMSHSKGFPKAPGCYLLVKWKPMRSELLDSILTLQPA